MTHTYKISGITCDGCVATVKTKLFLNPEITAVELNKEGEATISMQKHLSVLTLQDSIGKDSHYRIAEDKADGVNDAPEVTPAASWFTTYKPLLIIAGYITCISALLANGSFHLGMTYFMAGFFLVFSFFKLLDLRGFATSYAMYDLLASKVPVYGWVYPFIELGLGLSYLTGFSPPLTYWATLVVMGFSSIGVIQSVLNKQKIQCACLGSVFNLPMSTVTVIEDLLMVAMAGYMLARL